MIVRNTMPRFFAQLVAILERPEEPMPSCEKCWSDAFGRAYGSGRSQAECYEEIVAERKDNPCSPKQQAGQWWDEAEQRDTRVPR